jgi:two-component system response regulator
MEARFSQLNAPVLLFLEEENNTTSFSTGEFNKLAPHWKIVRVHDRLSAMRYFDGASAPKAFMIDLTMLDQSGMELIEWVKAQPQLRFLPIIVLSDSDDPSDRQHCVALGISSYLEKPKSFKELRNHILYIEKLCEGVRYHSLEWQEMACV